MEHKIRLDHARTVIIISSPGRRSAIARPPGFRLASSNADIPPKKVRSLLLLSGARTA